MDSQKNKTINVVLNPSFFIKFFISLVIFIAIFYTIAPSYIAFKVSIIKPILGLFYGAKTAPYLRSIPAYRGISLSLVCFFSLIASSLQIKSIQPFFRFKWKWLLGAIALIVVYEIVAIVIEIVSTGFIGYYITAVLLSVSSVILALLLWFLLFPSLKKYFLDAE
jgi:hypothetical protein